MEGSSGSYNEGIICCHAVFVYIIHYLRFRTHIYSNIFNYVYMFLFQLHYWLNKCCSFQDWGKPGDLWNLGIQWHVPSSSEVAFAFFLLDSFLQPELIKLQQCGDGEIEMSRLVFGFFCCVFCFFFNYLVLVFMVSD